MRVVRRNPVNAVHRNAAVSKFPSIELVSGLGSTRAGARDWLMGLTADFLGEVLEGPCRTKLSTKAKKDLSSGIISEVS